MMARLSVVRCAVFALAATGVRQATKPTWHEQQNLPEGTQVVFDDTAFALSTNINRFFLHAILTTTANSTWPR